MKGEKCQEASIKHILKHNKKCRLKKLGWTRLERKKNPSRIGSKGTTRDTTTTVKEN
jgi:hypothetical protein